MGTPVNATPDDAASSRDHGLDLACEGIMRSRFGKAPCSAGARALGRLQEELDSAGAIRRLSRTLWRHPVGLAAAAAVMVAAGLALVRYASYPEPTASGTYTVEGGGAIRRGATLVAVAEQVNVSLGGYCDLALAPDSRATIEGDEKDEAIFLHRGRVECSVDRDNGAFRVRTETGTVDVTGTRFIVQVQEEEGEGEVSIKTMFVKVLAGAVLVTAGSNGEARELREGEEATVREAPSVEEKTDTGALQKVKAALRQKVTFEMQDAPLFEAVAFLQTTTKLNIVIDPRAGDEREKKITLNVTNMQLGTALDWICRLADLRYVVTAEGVLITERDVNNQRNRDGGREGGGEAEMPREDGNREDEAPRRDGKQEAGDAKEEVF